MRRRRTFLIVFAVLIVVLIGGVVLLVLMGRGGGGPAPGPTPGPEGAVIAEVTPEPEMEPVVIIVQPVRRGQRIPPDAVEIRRWEVDRLPAEPVYELEDVVGGFAAIDLTPSLLKLAGAKGADGVSYDGREMLDTLLGKSQESRKEPIFFSRPPDRKNFEMYKNLPDLSVRAGQWKFLCDYDGGRPELYNLLTDVGETKNLAAENPDLVKDLTRKVTDWYQQMP